MTATVALYQTPDRRTVHAVAEPGPTSVKTACGQVLSRTDPRTHHMDTGDREPTCRRCARST